MENGETAVTADTVPLLDRPWAIIIYDSLAAIATTQLLRQPLAAGWCRPLCGRDGMVLDICPL